ncbi:TRAP transporter small permease [Ammoniphilus sp. YIM 78166]|uniref:TRAP transporter small permease n=1 Tax=Ammoniphilus sp. YIM 78166 TaxID=1644106 RepID=UPI00106FB734|nr:TRAP transporter small permease [Ammoniphilus sp. YIM 78166]
MNVLKKLNMHFEEYVCMLLLSLMVLLILTQVASRFLLNMSLDWSEELARFIFIWLIYISISLAAKYNRHIRVEALKFVLPPFLSKLVDLFALLCWLGFNGYMIFHGADMVTQILNTTQTSAAIGLNMGYIYSIVPIGFLLMSIRILQQICKALPLLFSKELPKNIMLDKNQQIGEI